MIDVLFFLFLTIFFIFKLKNVLGTRDGDDEARQRAIKEFMKQKNESENSNNVIDITETLKPDSLNLKLNFDISNNTKFALSKVNFDQNKFLIGAENVVEIVNDAFSDNDLQALEKMLSKALFENFEKQIIKLREKSRKLKTSIVGIHNKKIDAIVVMNDIISIDVIFDMEQINFVEDSVGKIVMGSRKKINEITEKWSFLRSVNSKENFWIVKNIENLNNV